MRSKFVVSAIAAIAALCVSFGGSASASCLHTPGNDESPVLSIISQSSEGPVFQVTSGDWQACSELTFEYVVIDGSGNVIQDDVDAGDSDTFSTLNSYDGLYVQVYADSGPGGVAEADSNTVSPNDPPYIR